MYYSEKQYGIIKQKNRHTKWQRASEVQENIGYGESNLSVEILYVKYAIGDQRMA